MFLKPDIQIKFNLDMFGLCEIISDHFGYSWNFIFTNIIFLMILLVVYMYFFWYTIKLKIAKNTTIIMN